MPGSRRTRAPAAISALLVATTILAGCGEKEEPDLTAATTTTATGKAAEVAGDWTGQLTQKGLAPFQVAVRIDALGSGQVAYTGINCAGRWGLGPVREGERTRYFFRETITRGAGGNCKGTGSIEITPAADGTLSYAFTGGGVESTGTLSRTDAAGVAPVFQQAGVPPPA